jgi:hypothetical protein
MFTIDDGLGRRLSARAGSMSGAAISFPTPTLAGIDRAARHDTDGQGMGSCFGAARSRRWWGSGIRPSVTLNETWLGVITVPRSRVPKNWIECVLDRFAAEES